MPKKLESGSREGSIDLQDPTGVDEEEVIRRINASFKESLGDVKKIQSSGIFKRAGNESTGAGATGGTVFESGSGKEWKEPETEKFRLRLLDKEGKPTEKLLDFLELFDLEDKHDGSLKGVVEFTQKDKRFMQKDPETGRRLDRWELEEIDCTPDVREKAMSYLEGFGIFAEIPPANKWHKYGLVHGGLIPRIAARFKYARELWKGGQRFDELVFLGSNRRLKQDKKSNVDEIRDFLAPDYYGLPVREGWKPPQNLPTTEYQLMLAMFDKIDMDDDMRASFKHGVASEANMQSDGTETRAITDNTTADWAKTDPKGTYMAIASNPDIYRMGLVMEEKIPDNNELKGETVGSAIAPNERTLEVGLGAFTRLLYQIQKMA